MAEMVMDSPELALERQAARHREVEHRVKNTLQLISSIVLLQGRRAKDEGARQALRAVQQRVAAVSVAHRHVSWSEETEHVEVAALVREIVGDLAGSAGREGVAIDLDLEPVIIAGRSGAPPSGFGLNLVQLMAQQLRGKLATDTAQPGLRLTVTVPMDVHASTRG
jgi:two-component sensor histidine kinase